VKYCSAKFDLTQDFLAKLLNSRAVPGSYVISGYQGVSSNDYISGNTTMSHLENWSRILHLKTKKVAQDL